MLIDKDSQSLTLMSRMRYRENLYSNVICGHPNIPIKSEKIFRTFANDKERTFSKYLKTWQKPYTFSLFPFLKEISL